MYMKPVLAGAILALGVTSSNAALLDFTADPTPTSVDGVSFSLSSNGPIRTFPYDGAVPLPGFASKIDGLGVFDDEISFPDDFITITFASKVLVSGLYYLDMFRAADDSDFEVAIATFDTGDVIMTPAVQFHGGKAPGFAFHLLETAILTQSITFTPGAGNDGRDVPDFALAGLDVAAIPLPTSAALFLTALAALGLLNIRRRES